MNYKDKVIDRLKSAETLLDGGTYNYVLTHTHDPTPRHFYVIAPYPEDTMNALIAFIQYECAEIEETYGMDQSDIIKVLTELYDCVKTKEVILADAMEINLFINWEQWVGSDVQAVSLFKRDALPSLLQSIVNEIIFKITP